MKIATSYFYQIRNFKEWMIPVSTAFSDPDWFRAPEEKEYFYDKRGIVCGLRYEPLITWLHGKEECPGPQQCQYFLNKEPCPVQFWTDWRLNNLAQPDKQRIIQRFEYCANKFQKEIGFKEEPIIALMVYEAPNNPCSERAALQKFFNCKELRYPIC